MASPSETNDAGTEFARTTQHAMTYAGRVKGTALARNQRHRADNAELIKRLGFRKLGPSNEPTPGALRSAAKRFRVAAGLPVQDLPDAADLVPPRPVQPVESPRSGDDDEDFSQARIMIHGE
ncbi:MAG: hypothetical protein JWQ81_4178 [Amycolatopsis sp.]|uniref:hypothetical protein n=1 Tax=Amycolatopsis sp. TaxID=37632 RepID=UPI002622758D|nr:hypothetical protein [Amycolatopsis sp.]MCU1683439.1 hypothetical protein [Amycolatopsis sp.]